MAETDEFVVIPFKTVNADSLAVILQAHRRAIVAAYMSDAAIILAERPEFLAKKRHVFGPVAEYPAHGIGAVCSCGWETGPQLDRDAVDAEKMRHLLKEPEGE